MMPIPQYPLFSSTVTEYGMYQINYYLNEEKQWAVDIEELQRAINLSKPYCEPKILVIINPGNPVGSVMLQKDMQNIIKFAYEEKLLIFADEVYQYNVYDSDSKFYSFKKVMKEMGLPYSNMQLASFMSASKGYMAECGSRGGYCEFVNLDKEIKDILMKLHCVRLSGNIHGQIIMYCISNPPGPDEPSYELFEQEKSSILQSLKEGAQYYYEKLNSVEGLSCSKIAGSIYAFPKIELSKKALEEAQKRKQSPDEFYAMELVETAGISVQPGYFFGQRPETYHFRLTILPQTDKLKIIIQRILEFHLQFLEKYKD
ncbi:alanine aminotransferase 2-like isoform X1 [Stegodyphus dumicola]|uniref:alanine aminotransferase 2-like isoform X1 n=1 Tax=Stegodyphus dumicola TaxID=202533 RepID=UPI0015A9E200|nr:alanine aminotransferase 2-like isoform X1 [Stegodyphus dumicola]